MLLQSFLTPGLAIHSYMIGDLKSKAAAVIDPTRELEPYLQFAKQEGLVISHILETHVHADYISGAKELKEKLNGAATIHCSAMGGDEWVPIYADHRVKNKDEINLGSIRLQAVHTPGHTPEHLTWICYDESRSKEVPCLAFTGDLLFVGGVGRPDLLGKEETGHLIRLLYSSLLEKTAQWPDFLEIFPGHGAGSLCGKELSARPSSTLGYERCFNSLLTKKPIEQWSTALLQDIPSAPINFKRIKKLNLQGPPLTARDAIKKDIVIDVRDPESFAKAHIKNSINIPLGNTFCNWVSSVIAEDCCLGIVAEKAEHINEAVKNLSLIGFDQIGMRTVWDDKGIQDSFVIESIPMVSVQDLSEKLNSPGCFLLDVRTPLEWKEGHIPLAHHLELTHLLEQMDQLPKNAFIHVICRSGYRASIAASILKKHGYPSVANIAGGMNAWTKANLLTI